MEKEKIEQVDVDQIPDTEESQDNMSGDFNISLNIPENIEIRMVNATQLSDYEIWFAGAGVILSIAAGFVVAWIQESEDNVKRVLGLVGLIFIFLFVFFLVMTLLKRHTLKKKGKIVKLYTSKVVESKK